MGDAVTTSPHVHSTCTQNTILSLLIIHIIPGYQINVAIDNPSLVPFVSCLTTLCYLCNSVCAADISPAQEQQSICCRCCAYFYKIRDGIQLTRVFRYCVEHQGYRMLIKSSILIQERNFKLLLQLPREKTIQCSMTSPWGLLCLTPADMLDSSVPAPASCASRNVRHGFTF